MPSILLAHAVDEAFARLAKLYGREFTGKFEDDAEEVKAAWMRELAALPRALEQIAWALRNLPERCPNAIQFRNLCRQAPSPQQVAMHESAAPVRGPSDDELDAIRELRRGIEHTPPGRAWAWDLLRRYHQGERISAGALRMAREVAESWPAPPGMLASEASP
jgi:hypothetical protein